MNERNTTQYGILGLLTWGPKSGYDIRKEVRESIGHFWSESYGQIYPVLRRLVAQRLATVRRVSGRAAANRKVYRITPLGRRELRRWLAQPLRPAPIRSELCLKLCFGVEVPPESSLKLVKSFRATHAARLEEYARTETLLKDLLRKEPQAVFFLLTLRMGLTVSRAAVGWADEAATALEHYAGRTSRGPRRRSTQARKRRRRIS